VLKRRFLSGRGRRSWVASVLLVLAVAGTSRAQEAAKVAREDGRETPLRVYRPESGRAQGCTPLALISPGAGGTENGYSYLAEGLRDRGWLAIVIGHKESGPKTLLGDVWKSGLHGGLTEMVTDPALHRDRLMDVGAALGWAENQCRRPFKALLGHSMGSDTVMFEAGADNKFGMRGDFSFGTGLDFPRTCVDQNPQASLRADGNGRQGPSRPMGVAYPPVRRSAARLQVAWSHRRRDAPEFRGNRLRGQDQEAYRQHRQPFSQWRARRALCTPWNATRNQVIVKIGREGGRAIICSNFSRWSGFRRAGSRPGRGLAPQYRTAIPRDVEEHCRHSFRLFIQTRHRLL
jgi:hypothetical protein